MNYEETRWREIPGIYWEALKAQPGLCALYFGIYIVLPLLIWGGIIWAIVSHAQAAA